MPYYCNKCYGKQTEPARAACSDPDLWIQSNTEGYRAFLDDARTEVAEYVGAEPQDLVFVENASAGCNSFLRSLMDLRPGSKILYLSCIYGMVKNGENSRL
eukprot:SAG31_NODE_3625_length_4056_cov_1.750126_4_plen_101_part_00